MNLTPHFTLEELACHDGTLYPEAWVASRAVPLCEAAEFIREQCGFPLIVNSGFRTEAYNRQIGGARNSQHVQGRALDLNPGKRGSLKVLQEAAKRAREVGLITGIGFYADFVHVDTREGAPATWYGSRTVARNMGEEA